jgi:anti-sigma regulatory factor (Ser/Thr protein kinase)
MPEKMFVTCLYGVLEPETGRFRFANAGHDLPYVKRAEGSDELRARGMPLGLMPGMPYEEKETILEPGDSVLLHSDGVVEAHDPQREMFGFPRLKQAVADYAGGEELIDRILADVQEHTGPDAEQEDDITMVVLTRSHGAAHMRNGAVPDTLLASFEVPSAEGNERLAISRVVEAVAPLGMPAARLERLKTAVGEATMNAMEHGSGYRADRPVSVRVATAAGVVRVLITDRGGAPEQRGEAEVPDLDAKLAGLQRPRGWGLFLIQSMVDELHESSDGERHTVELVVRVEGDEHGDA